jgi:hypothetical protein
LGDTSITSMEMRAAVSKISVCRRGMVLVWSRVEEEEVFELGEYPDASKEDKALEISICEGGGEDDRADDAEPGDAGSDLDTLSTVTCL